MVLRSISQTFDILILFTHQGPGLPKMLPSEFSDQQQLKTYKGQNSTNCCNTVGSTVLVTRRLSCVNSNVEPAALFAIVPTALFSNDEPTIAIHCCCIMSEQSCWVNKLFYVVPTCMNNLFKRKTGWTGYCSGFAFYNKPLGIERTYNQQSHFLFTIRKSWQKSLKFIRSAMTDPSTCRTICPALRAYFSQHKLLISKYD